MTDASLLPAAAVQPLFAHLDAFGRVREDLIPRALGLHSYHRRARRALTGQRLLMLAVMPAIACGMATIGLPGWWVIVAVLAVALPLALLLHWRYRVNLRRARSCRAAWLRMPHEVHLLCADHAAFTVATGRWFYLRPMAKQGRVPVWARASTSLEQACKMMQAAAYQRDCLALALHRELEDAGFPDPPDVKGLKEREPLAMRLRKIADIRTMSGYVPATAGHAA